MDTLLRALIGATASLCLAGCSTPSRNAELAWQVLNLADTVQSADGVSRGCAEGNPIAGSTPQSVVLAGAAFGLAHVMVTRWLEDHDASRGMMIAWHTVGIAAKGYAVIHNSQQGCR
jgi:hypothetical protein